MLVGQKDIYRWLMNDEDETVDIVIPKGVIAVSTLDYDENGQLAVEACRNTSFSTILMDCQMPVMDGLAATQAIREMEGAGQRTPIIALTAGAFNSDRESCLSVGMDDYLTKPVNARKLEQTLRHWVAKRESPLPIS